MIIVTGACGFIGSNLVASLASEGHEITAVDVASKMVGANFPSNVYLMDSDMFRQGIRTSLLGSNVTHIFHLGACADTMETNESIMMESNVVFSKDIMWLAAKGKIPTVYASSAAVYGNSDSSTEIRSNENPINLYAKSKLMFDNILRQNKNGLRNTFVGLRFFNVYGPSEARKGKMASMPYQIWKQIKEDGVCNLFGETEGCAAGEQKRDFVSVEDVISVMKYFAFKTEPVKGVFNVGTGVARSFNDVANTVIGALGSGRVEYVPFPEVLVGKYQMNTCADLTALRGAGYSGDFKTIEEGVVSAIVDWNKNG